MTYENGQFYMNCVSPDSPGCVKTAGELAELINDIGFLPLFSNEIEGFSAEEHTAARYWWSGDERRDPWEWRVEIARGEKIAYGKFFGGKAGFVSLERFPEFANFRRDGYDFDSRWEDGLADHRCKKIMDCFDKNDEYIGVQLKRIAGFGKQGEKNFNGIITELQMQTYLVIRDFRYKQNKRGESYGMPVSVYAKPETLWGAEFIAKAYRTEPEKSRELIRAQVKKFFPRADEKALAKVIR